MVNEKAIKVAELKPGETGRGIARLDPELMDILGIKVGDIVQIDGTVTRRPSRRSSGAHPRTRTAGS